jgi:hypothetical protein
MFTGKILNLLAIIAVWELIYIEPIRVKAAAAILLRLRIHKMMQFPPPSTTQIFFESFNPSYSNLLSLTHCAFFFVRLAKKRFKFSAWPV